MSKFSWAEGYRPKISADVAGEVLAPLVEQCDKFIAPSTVVDLARDEGSPLHPAFEWNDALAGEQHRLFQARNMLRCLRVKIEQVTNTTEPVRFFVNVKATPELAEVVPPPRRYTTVAHAMSDPTLRAQVLSNALKELESFRRKYAQFQELAGIHAEVDNLLAERIEPENPGSSNKLNQRRADPVPQRVYSVVNVFS